MTFIRIQFSSLELDIVFLNISAHRIFEHLVTIVHLNTKGIQCIDNFGVVCYDGLFTIWQLGQIMPFDFIE